MSEEIKVKPLTQPVRRVTIDDLNAGLEPEVVASKAVYLVYGVKSERLKDITAGRWQPFENDDAAKTSKVYADYDYAVIADTVGVKPRLLWTKDSGWQDAN